MRTVILGLAIGIALAGCAKPEPTPEELEANYNFIVAHNGDQRDKCEAATKIKTAYLKNKNAVRYDIWKWTASNVCNGSINS